MVSEGIGEIRLELQERLKRAGDDRISAKALARKFGKCIRGIFGDRGNGCGEGARGYVEPDEAESQYAIGEKHFSAGEYEDAAKWYVKTATQGFPPAVYSLVYLYWIGRGLRRNLAEAMRLFLAAAAQGNDWAENCLGNMYRYGHGVRPDSREAAKYPGVST